MCDFVTCRRLVVVMPEVSSSPPPVPSSCSIYASSVYANEDAFRREVQKLMLMLYGLISNMHSILACVHSLISPL